MSPTAKRTRRRYPKTITTRHPRKRDDVARKAALAELKTQIFALRRNGFSYVRIAKQLDCSTSFAHKTVQESLDELNTTLALSREQYRTLAVASLDDRLVQLEGWLREGRTVKESPDGRSTVVTIQRPAVGYLFAWLRAVELRAKLLGILTNTIELMPPSPERELTDDELMQRAEELRREIEAEEARRQVSSTPSS